MLLMNDQDLHSSIIITLAGFNPGEGHCREVDWIVRVGVDRTHWMGYWPLEMSMSRVFCREVIVLGLTVNTPVSRHSLGLPCQQLELLLVGGDVEDSDGPVGLPVDYFISGVGGALITDTAQELSLHHSCSVQQTSLTSLTVLQYTNVTVSPWWCYQLSILTED